MKLNRREYLKVGLGAVVSLLLILALIGWFVVGQETKTAPVKPGEVRTIGGMEFVWIPAGEFQMGSKDGDEDEIPVHKVTVSGFWMGKYEVRQADWRPIMAKGKQEWLSKVSSRDTVEYGIAWDNAVKFCEEFSKLNGVKARLPYEAEWEYACRAGTTTKYYWGDRVDENYLWYIRGIDGDFIRSGSVPAPVGKKKPNAFGLYDMSGNLYEWCQDWYSPQYTDPDGVKDPHGPKEGTRRVLRGGSWVYFEHVHRSANRDALPPASKYEDVGFRVVIEPDKQ